MLSWHCQSSTNTTLIEMKRARIIILTKVFKLWNITHILPLLTQNDRTKSYKFHSSKFRLFHSMIIFSITITGFIFTDEFGNTNVKSMNLQTYHLLFISYIFYTLFTVYNNTEIIEENLKILKQTDKKALKCFGQIYENGNYGFNWSVCYGIFLILLFLIEIYFCIKSTYLSWVDLIISFPCYILDFHFQLFYCTIKSLLSFYLKLLNHHLMQKQKQINRLDIFEVYNSCIVEVSKNSFFMFQKVLPMRSLYTFYSIVASLFRLSEAENGHMYEIYILSFFWATLESAVLLSNIYMDVDLMKKVS